MEPEPGLLQTLNPELIILVLWGMSAAPSPETDLTWDVVVA